VRLPLPAALLLVLAPLALFPSCSDSASSGGITGVYDATQQLQAGNTATIRYWFTSDGKWGRVLRQTVGGTPTDTCSTTASATYELSGNKVTLRHGSSTQERTWTLLEGDGVLKLDPPDQFQNGTFASTFTRVPNAQTNRDCNTAFQ